MNVLEVVELEFCKELEGRRQSDNGLWFLGERKRGNDLCIDLWVSECPGGAYNAFGDLVLTNDSVVLRLKTVWGIIRHQSRHSIYNFEFCNPDFPDNVLRLVQVAGSNAIKAFRLGHSRMWARHRRTSSLR